MSPFGISQPVMSFLEFRVIDVFSVAGKTFAVVVINVPSVLLSHGSDEFVGSGFGHKIVVVVLKAFSLPVGIILNGNISVFILPIVLVQWRISPFGIGQPVMIFVEFRVPDVFSVTGETFAVVVVHVPSVLFFHGVGKFVGSICGLKIFVVVLKAFPLSVDIILNGNISATAKLG